MGRVVFNHWRQKMDKHDVTLSRCDGCERTCDVDCGEFGSENCPIGLISKRVRDNAGLLREIRDILTDYQRSQEIIWSRFGAIEHNVEELEKAIHTTDQPTGVQPDR